MREERKRKREREYRMERNKRKRERESLMDWVFINMLEDKLAS